MTDNQLNLLAAAFARSNMGFPMEDFSELASSCRTLSLSVERVCGGFVEDDDQFEAFLAEARMWWSILRDEYHLREYRKTSPHVFTACGV